MAQNYFSLLPDVGWAGSNGPNQRMLFPKLRGSYIWYVAEFWSVTYRQNVEWDIEFGVGGAEWEEEGERGWGGSPKVAGSVQGQVFLLPSPF